MVIRAGTRSGIRTDIQRRLAAAATGLVLIAVAGCAPSLPRFGGNGDNNNPAAGAAAAGGILDGVLGRGCGSLLMGWAGLMSKFTAGMGSQTGLTQSDLNELQQLGSAVPDELKPDFKVLGDAITNGMGKSADEMSKSMDTPQTQAAIDHIEAWVNTHCVGATTG